MTNKTADTPGSTAAATDPAETKDAADVRVDDSAGADTEDSAAVGVDDPAGQDTEDSAAGADEGLEGAPTDLKSPHPRRSISIGVRSLMVAVVIAMLAAAVGILGWLYIGAEHKLGAQASQSANNSHVEKIAVDYAVNAATMDFNDLQAWKVRLVAGTSPELNDKLTKAAVSMEQILVPLQWTSTAKPLVAKVRSTSGGVYVVDCFVSVQTKTVQAAEALQSTATYSVTIDGNKNWQITDVGGIGSVVGPK